MKRKEAEKGEKALETEEMDRDQHCKCHSEEGGHCHCHDDDEDGEEEEEKGRLVKIIIAFVLFVLGIVAANAGIFENPRLISGIIFLASYMFCGRPVVLRAARNLSKKDFFDEQFLMTVASLGAIVLGEFSEGVAVMLFYQVGEWFQDYALDKSRDSINSLMEICPDKANVIRGGETVEVDAVSVLAGETVVVKPGERIPVDGMISEGSSFIDNSALTGESVPVEVSEGMEVLSGGINKNAVIKIKCLRPASESAASRIISLVEESSKRKAKTEHLITRFAKIYTPVVCFAALAVAVIFPIVQGLTGLGTGAEALGFSKWTEWNWSVWIYRALSFLVVSCPCAIVISVPLAFFGGIGAASKNGILVKGSAAIENLAKIKTFVFDKTGTITKGVFKVTGIFPSKSSGISEDELLKVAAHAEYYSEHPVSKSLKLAHNGDCCSKITVKDAEELSGHGIKVNLDGKTVLCGNERLMKLHEVSGFEDEVHDEAGTVIHVAQDGKYLGRIVISDEIKSDSKAAIADLHKNGVLKTVMLTGDGKKAAEKVASEVCIDEVYFQLLPEDKVSKVEALLEDGEKLAFVGDGINDAPVLARSDVGIAMGGFGSDAAIESADVVIMNDGLSKLPVAMKIAGKTMAIVVQNIVFSIGIKFLIMVLSALGITNMWAAVFGDVGVCFLAVLNAMRMLKVRISK